MLMADDLLAEMQALGVAVVPQPEFLWWLTGAYLKGLGARRVADAVPQLAAGGRRAGLQLRPARRAGRADSGLARRRDAHQPRWDMPQPRRGVRPARRSADVHRRRGVCHDDDSIGSLAPGKQARFMMLSHPPEQIADADMQVLATSRDLLHN